MTFTDVSEVARAYETRKVELHARQRADQGNGPRRRRAREVDKITRYATTVGRSILSEILPPGLPFAVLNKPLKKKEISRLINASFRQCGLRETVIFADQLMQAGFRLATRGGISFAADDMLVPEEKHQIIGEAERR